MRPVRRSRRLRAPRSAGTERTRDAGRVRSRAGRPGPAPTGASSVHGERTVDRGASRAAHDVGRARRPVHRPPRTVRELAGARRLRHRARRSPARRDDRPCSRTVCGDSSAPAGRPVAPAARPRPAPSGWPWTTRRTSGCAGTHRRRRSRRREQRRARVDGSGSGLTSPPARAHDRRRARRRRRASCRRCRPPATEDHLRSAAGVQEGAGRTHVRAGIGRAARQRRGRRRSSGVIDRSAQEARGDAPAPGSPWRQRSSRTTAAQQVPYWRSRPSDGLRGHAVPVAPASIDAPGALDPPPRHAVARPDGAVGTAATRRRGAGLAHDVGPYPSRSRTRTRRPVDVTVSRAVVARPRTAAT